MVATCLNYLDYCAGRVAVPSFYIFLWQQRSISRVDKNHGLKLMPITVADPGFPMGGGVDLVRGAVDPRGGYVSKILHVKTKESGPVGGGVRRARPPLDPPMHYQQVKFNTYIFNVECRNLSVMNSL